jgi:ribosome assembly protein 4
MSAIDDPTIPEYKKRRLAAAAAALEEAARKEAADAVATVIVQFASREGDMAGPQLELPYTASTQQMESLLNELLSNQEKTPYSFYLNEDEIMSSLRETITAQGTSTENALTIIYQPQAIFRVRPVTRCMSDLPGHSEAVLAVQFSPCGTMLASGSGDTTVRIWDLFTNTPQFTCKGHKNWVLSISWAPNAKMLASAGMDNEVRVWDPKSGRPQTQPLRGHTGYVTCLAWEPLNTNPKGEHLASGSKDNSIKIWNVRQQACVMTLSGHTNKVSALRWGGAGLLYSASHDRTIKVWDPIKVCLPSIFISID